MAVNAQQRRQNSFVAAVVRPWIEANMTGHFIRKLDLLRPLSTMQESGSNAAQRLARVNTQISAAIRSYSVRIFSLP